MDPKRRRWSQYFTFSVGAVLIFSYYIRQKIAKNILKRILLFTSKVKLELFKSINLMLAEQLVGKDV